MSSDSVVDAVRPSQQIADGVVHASHGGAYLLDIPTYAFKHTVQLRGVVIFCVCCHSERATFLDYLSLWVQLLHRPVAKLLTESTSLTFQACPAKYIKEANFTFVTQCEENDR